MNDYNTATKQQTHPMVRTKECIIKYPHYSEGAILKNCRIHKYDAIHEVMIDKTGNTMVVTHDGRIFNCHPVTKAVGLPDAIERRVMEEDLGIERKYMEGSVVYHHPVYPIRWELTEFEIDEWVRDVLPAGHYVPVVSRLYD